MFQAVEMKCLLSFHPTLRELAQDLILQSTYMKPLYDQKWEPQDIAQLASHVEQMKAIANHMINAFQVILAYLIAVLLVLALPIPQAVVKVWTTWMLVVAMLM